MELRLGSSSKKEAEDEPTKGSLAGGCCFDFNKVGIKLLALVLLQLVAMMHSLADRSSCHEHAGCVCNHSCMQVLHRLSQQKP